MGRVAGREIKWVTEVSAIQDMFNEGRTVKEVADYYAVNPSWIHKLIKNYRMNPPVRNSARDAAVRGWARVQRAKLAVFKAQTDFSPQAANLTVQNITWNLTCPATGSPVDYHATKGDLCYPMLHLPTLHVISKQAHDLLQTAKDDPAVLRKCAAFVDADEGQSHD